MVINEPLESKLTGPRISYVCGYVGEGYTSKCRTPFQLWHAPTRPEPLLDMANNKTLPHDCEEYIQHRKVFFDNVLYYDALNPFIPKFLPLPSTPQ